MDLEELERAAGLNPDSPDYRLRQQLAEADDQLIESLVQMRKGKGLTQRVVAKRMKRDVAAVSNFERLRADPHLSTIRRYAAAIGASVSHRVVDVDADGAPPDEGPISGRIDFALRLLEQLDRDEGERFVSQLSEAWIRHKKQSGEASDTSSERFRALAMKFLSDTGTMVGHNRS